MNPSLLTNRLELLNSRLERLDSLDALQRRELLLHGELHNLRADLREVAADFTENLAAAPLRALLARLDDLLGATRALRPTVLFDQPSGGTVPCMP